MKKELYTQQEYKIYLKVRGLLENNDKSPLITHTNCTHPEEFRLCYHKYTHFDNYDGGIYMCSACIICGKIGFVYKLKDYNQPENLIGYSNTDTISCSKLLPLLQEEYAKLKTQYTGVLSSKQILYLLKLKYKEIVKEIKSKT